MKKLLLLISLFFICGTGLCQNKETQTSSGKKTTSSVKSINNPKNKKKKTTKTVRIIHTAPNQKTIDSLNDVYFKLKTKKK